MNQKRCYSNREEMRQLKDNLEEGIRDTTAYFEMATGKVIEGISIKRVSEAIVSVEVIER